MLKVQTFSSHTSAASVLQVVVQKLYILVWTLKVQSLKCSGPWQDGCLLGLNTDQCLPQLYLLLQISNLPQDGSRVLDGLDQLVAVLQNQDGVMRPRTNQV